MDFAEIMTKYALPIIVMAIAVNIIVGIVKSFIKPKRTGEWMSRLYIGLAFVGSVLCVMVYNLAIAHEAVFKTWAFWKDSLLVYSCSQAIYQIYRKFGGRTLLLKIIEACRGKNKNLDEILKAVKALVEADNTLIQPAKEQVLAKLTPEAVTAEMDKPIEKVATDIKTE